MGSQSAPPKPLKTASWFHDKPYLIHMVAEWLENSARQHLAAAAELRRMARQLEEERSLETFR